jgi:phosphohistidine phosphatase
MPRRLILVRHARAEPSSGDDLSRPLTAEGEAQARSLGGRLREVGPGPVLSSPATRCRQTASALLAALGRKEGARPCDALAEKSSVHDLLPVVAGAADGTILVGHHPSLMDLACALLRTTTAPFTLSPGTAIVLEKEGAAEWTLASVLSPHA